MFGISGAERKLEEVRKSTGSKYLENKKWVHFLKGDDSCEQDIIPECF